MSYNWDLMYRLLREIDVPGEGHFQPRQLAEAFAVEREDAGFPVPDLDDLRAEAAAYESDLIEAGFIEQRPGQDGENYQLTARGQRLHALLGNAGERTRIRAHFDDAGEAILTPEIFDAEQAKLP